MNAGASTIYQSRPKTGSDSRQRHTLTPPPNRGGVLFWTNDHQEWYRAVYLKSEHWRELRRRKLLESPHCERCGCCESNPDIHHVNYRNIFDVETSDLLTLCRACHKQEHQVNGMPRRSLAPLRQSQKEFPQSARIKIHQQAMVKYGKLIRHIERLLLEGKSINNSKRRMADLHRQLAV
jgi:hypothetical protein